MLKLADCEHPKRLNYKDTGDVAREWERPPDADEASFARSWRLLEQGPPEMEPMDLSCDDLKSPELDGKHSLKKSRACSLHALYDSKGPPLGDPAPEWKTWFKCRLPTTSALVRSAKHHGSLRKTQSRLAE